MDDYISRQAAIEAAKHAWAKGLEPTQYIEQIPAADVRPVVYAEPVRIFDDPYTGRMLTTCSRCTGKISPKDKFCKHCGADMRDKKV